MGLDMYLTKEIYVWSGEGREDIKITGIKISDEDSRNIKSIRVNAGQWRKANQIHNWFVNNVQDGVDNCQEFYVPKDKLKELLKTVCIVLASTKLVKGKVHNGTSYENGVETKIFEDGKIMRGIKVARELLPATAGFFFGGTEYDQYYYDDLVDTRRILEEALRDESNDYYYRASW